MLGVVGETETHLHPQPPRDALCCAEGVECGLVESSAHEVAGGGEDVGGEFGRYTFSGTKHIAPGPAHGVGQVCAAGGVGEHRVVGDGFHAETAQRGVVDRLNPLFRWVENEFGATSDQAHGFRRRGGPLLGHVNSMHPWSHELCAIVTWHPALRRRILECNNAWCHIRRWRDRHTI